MPFSAIEKMIYQRTGLTFDAHRTRVLRDKINWHMTSLGVDDMGYYYNDIRADHALFDLLVDQLTINESYFFREPAYLDLLCHRMIPELAGKNKRKRLSILSAGCSTGEEPCSIAMALEQAHGSAVLSNIQIFGVDIDNTALSMARAGIYGKWKLRQLAPLLLPQYFNLISDGQYAIKPDILNKIQYYSVNLVAGPLPTEIQTVDIIFYRNVSIYFDKATRMKVFSHLEKALTPGGYLVVGAAETLSHDTGALSLVEMDGCFVYQKIIEKTHAPGKAWVAGKQRSIPPLSPRKMDGVKNQIHSFDTNGKTLGKPRRTFNLNCEQAESPIRTARGSYEKALVLARQKKFDPALALLEPILETKDEIKEKVLILRAGLLMQKGAIEKAKNLCQHLIEMNVSCAPAYLLLGMIASMEQEPMESLKRFRETSYIQPDNWLAHFLMFQTYQTLESKKETSRQATVVVRLLEKKIHVHHGLDYFPFSFSREQILHLCRQHTF